MKLSDFNYDLPKNLLAEFPSENRDESRLMVIDRKTQKIEHYQFKDLIDFISTPSKIFNLNKKHKNVRLYSQVKMTEKEFENEVELCRGKQT